MTAPQPWTPPERMLTPQQASIRARLSVKTLARYAREGRLECVRDGRGWRRYPESAIDGLYAWDELEAPAWDSS